MSTTRLLASQVLGYIYTPVQVRRPSDTKALSYVGMWDTAATMSMVSSRVVEELKLEAIPQQRRVTSILGDTYIDQYEVDFVLEGAPVENIRAAKTVSLPNIYEVDGTIDVLIGMDVIKQGDLVLSHARGRTEFRFRMPAQGIRGWG